MVEVSVLPSQAPDDERCSIAFPGPTGSQLVDGSLICSERYPLWPLFPSQTLVSMLGLAWDAHLGHLQMQGCDLQVT